MTKILVALREEQSRADTDALYNELVKLELPVEPPEEIVINLGESKGDPITLLTVLAVAVGSGGALTVALSKDRFS